MVTVFGSLVTTIAYSMYVKKESANHLAKQKRNLERYSDDALSRHKQELETEYQRKNSYLVRHKHKLEVETGAVRDKIHKNFKDLTGISYADFEKIMASRELNAAITPYIRRANGYIKRLEAINQRRMQQFRSKPVTTAASEYITEKHLGKPISKLESLRREIELCRKKAVDAGIEPPVGTEPTLCEIVRVIDGDTFLIKVENKSFRLRVMGFDTPEVCHPTKGFGHWGIQASSAAQKIVSEGARFEVFLDKKSLNEHNLYNDRYGRIIGHIKVDGEMFGHKMLETGNAEIVDFFPIEDEIIADYRKAEFSAKQENIGMWKEINEYKLMKKVESARKAKFTFHDVIETKMNSDYTKEVIRQIFIDLAGTSVVQSKRGNGKIHKHDCRYVGVIKDSETIVLDEQWIERNAHKLKPCKVCNGDDIVLEALD